MKKVIVALGLAGGLGLALVFFYLYTATDGQAPELPAKPGEAVREAVQPVVEPPPTAKVAEPTTTVPAASEPPLAAPTPSPPSPPVPPAPAVSPAPEKKEVKAPSPGPSFEEHGLLSGRYRSYKEARRAMDKISRKGIPAFVRKKGKFYEVWAGPFLTPQEAAQAGRKLKTALKISATARRIDGPGPK